MSPIHQNPFDLEYLTTSSDDVASSSVKKTDDAFGIKTLSRSKPIHLHEMVTIDSKPASTDMVGHINKVSLSIPELKLYKVEEFPIHSRTLKDNIKDYIHNWESKLNSFKGFSRIHSTHWNNPEGCVSIVQELCLGGSLQDLMSNIGGNLPENCLKELTTSILQCFNYLHNKANMCFGTLTGKQVHITSDGEFMLAPNLL